MLDLTCGSGTTAYVAEEWGRRWITIDTSRVPLALARQRLLTATFPVVRTPKTMPEGQRVGSSINESRTRRARKSGYSSTYYA